MATYEVIAKKHSVTPEQVKQLQSAMCDVWDMVGYDFVTACGGEVEAMEIFDSETEMIAEATIDADRINYSTRHDMSWVYSTEDGKSRKGVMGLARDAWDCSP